MTKIITVSRDQVLAARALIDLRGGERNVDQVIVRIAHADVAKPAKPAGKAS